MSVHRRNRGPSALQIPLLALATALALVFLPACKPRVEGQTKDWQEKQKKAADYADKYPGFGKALAEAQAQAKAVWDEAAKIPTDDEKAGKMRQANDTFAKLLEPIGQYESHVDAAMSAQKKAGTRRYPAKVVKQIESQIDAASAALSKAVDAMTDARPASLTEAIKAATDADEAATSAIGKFAAVLSKAVK